MFIKKGYRNITGRKQVGDLYWSRNRHRWIKLTDANWPFWKADFIRLISMPLIPDGWKRLKSGYKIKNGDKFWNGSFFHETKRAAGSLIYRNIPDSFYIRKKS
jgi:hypothetical protein